VLGKDLAAVIAFESDVRLHVRLEMRRSYKLRIAYLTLSRRKINEFKNKCIDKKNFKWFLHSGTFRARFEEACLC